MRNKAELRAAETCKRLREAQVPADQAVILSVHLARWTQLPPAVVCLWD